MKFFIKLLLSFPSTPSSHSEIASSVQWIGQYRTSLLKRGQVQSSFPSLLFAKDRYLFSYHKSFIKNSFCKKTVEAQYSELVWLLLYDADMCILRKSVNNSFTFELIQLTKLTQMNVWTQYVQILFSSSFWERPSLFQNILQLLYTILLLLQFLMKPLH